VARMVARTTRLEPSFPSRVMAEGLRAWEERC
jgi:hypothetical protein